MLLAAGGVTKAMTAVLLGGVAGLLLAGLPPAAKGAAAAGVEPAMPSLLRRGTGLAVPGNEQDGAPGEAYAACTKWFMKALNGPGTGPA